MHDGSVRRVVHVLGVAAKPSSWPGGWRASRPGCRALRERVPAVQSRLEVEWRLDGDWIETAGDLRIQLKVELQFGEIVGDEVTVLDQRKGATSVSL